MNITYTEANEAVLNSSEAGYSVLARAALDDSCLLTCAKAAFQNTSMLEWYRIDTIILLYLRNTYTQIEALNLLTEFLPPVED